MLPLLGSEHIHSDEPKNQLGIFHSDTSQLRLRLSFFSSPFLHPADFLRHVYLLAHLVMLALVFSVGNDTLLYFLNRLRFHRTKTQTDIHTPPSCLYCLQLDLPVKPVQSANHLLRHTAVKMARLTRFDGKGVQIFFTNKQLTLKM